MPGQSFRFGLGDPSGCHSGTWAVRSWTDGSVYVGPRGPRRKLKGLPKASLHPVREDGTGGRWKIEYQHLPDDSEVDPLVAEWDSQRQRLGDGPVRQGVGVVLGRFSLGPPNPDVGPAEAQQELSHLQKAEWLPDLPPLGHAWQWTVLVVDARSRSTPPGTRSMGATHVATLDLGDQGDHGEAHIMRHLIEVDTAMSSAIEHEMHRFGHNVAAQQAEGRHVYRQILTTKEPNGFRGFTELALSVGFSDDELELPAS